ncbi:MAG TPA: FHA domain-containing protein [Gemmataceae bacterium]|nr:FHA domain-containing protein [Gemmataceae bacterium]
MDVKLVIEQPRVKKRTLRLRADEGVIGRAHGCALRIQSAEVSREHCRLRVRDGYLTVEDLNSRNGTQLNGEDVKGRQVVRPGDRLRVGPVTFVVEYQLTPEAIDRLLRGDDAEVIQDAAPEVAPTEDGLLPLEGLAEGVEEEALPLDEVEEIPEEAPLPLEALAEAVEDEVVPVEEVLPEEEEVVPVETAEAVDELEVLDAGEFQLPESEELRDILTGLEEEDEPPRKRKKK